jgi:hypothetical protein
VAFSDNYTLEVPLGESELGTTWAARTKDGVRVVVAMTEEDAPEAVRKRVEAHGRALLGLQHPNVARVLDAGVDVGGAAFLVMERLEGTSLAKRWEAEPALRADRMLEIGIGIVEALSKVHAITLPDGTHLAHGDVEPGNVLLVGAPGKEVPKLIGWGLSRAHARAGGGRVSAASVTPFTYGAPEQVRGEVQEAPSADLYSAAALVFAGLAGRPPHVAPDPAAIAEAIASRTPPSLSSLRKELAPFAATLDRALSSDPKKRFADAAALARALRTSLAMGRSAGTKELVVGPRTAIGPADPVVAQLTTSPGLAAKPGAQRLPPKPAVKTPTASDLAAPAEAEPTATAAEPAEIDAKPSEADAKPSEADAKPSEADTKASEADAKPSEADAKPAAAAPVPDLDDEPVEEERTEVAGIPARPAKAMPPKSPTKPLPLRPPTRAALAKAEDTKAESKPDAPEPEAAAKDETAKSETAKSETAKSETAKSETSPSAPEPSGEVEALPSSELELAPPSGSAVVAGAPEPEELVSEEIELAAEKPAASHGPPPPPPASMRPAAKGEHGAAIEPPKPHPPEQKAEPQKAEPQKAEPQKAEPQKAEPLPEASPALSLEPASGDDALDEPVLPMAKGPPIWALAAAALALLLVGGGALAWMSSGGGESEPSGSLGTIMAPGEPTRTTESPPGESGAGAETGTEAETGTVAVAETETEADTVAETEAVAETAEAGTETEAAPQLEVGTVEEVAPAPTPAPTPEPATTQPATTRPATTRPATTRPATTRPATARPATGRPTGMSTTPAGMSTTPVGRTTVVTDPGF